MAPEAAAAAVWDTMVFLLNVLAFVFIGGSVHAAMHRRAVSEARSAVFEMRARGEIGDNPFHRLEEELDWVELGSGGRG